MIIGVRASQADPVPPIIANGGPLGFDVDDVPYALILTGDGIQIVRLSGSAAERAASLAPGQWAKFEGEKEHEQLFDATAILSP